MLYKNSPIGELQERRHNEDQARSFNAVDTKATKIDILETKFFGNNTIPREENYPIIEEATTADPNTIRDEILPSDKVMLKKEIDMGFSSLGIPSPVKKSSNVISWAANYHNNREYFSAKQAFVTIMGRVLDSHADADSSDLNTGYTASAIGQTLKVKINDWRLSSNERIVVPCIPVYGKLRSDPYVLDLANSDKKWFNFNTKPFPSITFPIIMFTDDDQDGLAFKPFPGKTYLSTNINVGAELGKQSDYIGHCLVQNSINPDIWSQAAIHAHLYSQFEKQDNGFISNRVSDDNDTVIFDDEVYSETTNSDYATLQKAKFKFGSYTSYVKRNVAYIDYGEGFNTHLSSLDGLGLKGRVYKDFYCFDYTSSDNTQGGLTASIEITYRAELISNTTSKLTTEEDEYFAEGESIYAFVPVGLTVTELNGNDVIKTTSVEKELKNLYWYDEDRYTLDTNKDFEILHGKSLVFDSDEESIIAYYLREKEPGDEPDKDTDAKIVFAYKDKRTGNEFTPAYYNSPEIKKSDINKIVFKDIIADTEGDEKLFIISYSIGNKDYTATLTCIPLISYYSISSLMVDIGLNNHWVVNCEYDDKATQHGVYEAEHPIDYSSINTVNKHEISLAGLVIRHDNPDYLYSAPYSFLKVALYQMNKSNLTYNKTWELLEGNTTDGDNKVKFLKVLHKDNAPYILPSKIKSSGGIFVWGNSFHAWKSNLTRLNHTSGVFRQVMLPSYMTQGHAEYQDSVALYTDAIALPILFPILYAMKNNDDYTVIKQGMNRVNNSDLPKGDRNARRMLFIKDPSKNVALPSSPNGASRMLNVVRGLCMGRYLNGNELLHLATYPSPKDYTGMNVHLLSIDENHGGRNSFSNSYMKVENAELLFPEAIDEDNITSNPHKECYKGFVGTIMIYPTKQLDETGVYSNMDTVLQYNGMSFSNSEIIKGNSILRLNNKAYILHNKKFYTPSLLYKYTSTNKNSVFINSLSGAGVIKLHTVGAYLFMVKETHSEVYYQDENEIVPLFADSGTIVDSPVISGMDVFFCILSTDKTQIKVYSINRLDVVKRGIIYSSSEVKNSIVFWSSKVKYPAILYTEGGEYNRIKITFKAIFPAGVVSMGNLPTISGQNITDLLIRTKTVNGAVGEPEFLISIQSGSMVAYLDSEENKKQSMKIKSSVITLPEYQENMFILTGIEVSVIQHKFVEGVGENDSPLSRTLKISIYNAFNSSLIKGGTFNGKNKETMNYEIDKVHGKVLLSLSPDIDIRRIYYTIESEGYKITGVNLVGYFTELI